MPSTMACNKEIDEEKGTSEPLLNHPSNKSLGGVKILPFILANELFERAAFFGLQPNMILYLMGVYGLEMASGSNIIFLWGAATNCAPILGAFLADAYVGRFRMIGIGCVSTLMGMMLLWSTTTIPGVKPSKETPATLFQIIYLCLSFGLMSIGAGGLRSSGLAFGADQLQNIKDDDERNPNSDSSRAIASFVNWYYFSMTVAMIFALTCIVYIQDHMGWQVGFGVPVTLMLMSTISFFSASSFYVKIKPMASVLARPAQVIVASWRNRGCKFSSHLGTKSVYYAAEGSVYEAPSEKLRFLNKACIVRDQGQFLAPDNEKDRNPWRLCTIDQVEELKSILKVIPLWSTGILICTSSITHSSFMVLQAKSMERHVITRSFELPPASLNAFALGSLMLWLILYDRIIIPLGSKLKGKPVNINALTRVGIGLLLSSSGMVIASFVESVRRGTIVENRVDQMWVLWLVPQVCLIGVGDGLTGMAQIEFFYSEFPRSMSSIASNLHGFSFSIASLLASLVLSIIDYATKQDGKPSWVSSDPNKGHYDYYYWVLAGFNMFNYIYFLLCKRAYRKDKRVSQENNQHR